MTSGAPQSTAGQRFADLLDWLGHGVTRLVPRYSPAWRLLRRVRALLPYRYPDYPSARFLKVFAGHYPRCSFLQIGANDGEQRDPLRLFVETRRWHGVMIEPVPFVFERLRARYQGHPRVRLENAAIADRDGVLPFYHLAQARPGEDLPRWYDALGSFRREVIVKHADMIPDLERRIVQRDVPTLSFDSLCRKHAITRLDLVQIDTEGYDYEILKHIDWSRWRPALVIYEHHHLSPADRAACQAMLRAQGYDPVEESLDTVAFRLEGAAEPLRAAWAEFGVGAAEIQKAVAAAEGTH
ncbi:MAG TPA: FkbM family methyltransferase [Nevskia sp.]|nr:FkbM family methyltransferase [Nevskia sp.]